MCVPSARCISFAQAEGQKTEVGRGKTNRVVHVCPNKGRISKGIKVLHMFCVGPGRLTLEFHSEKGGQRFEGSHARTKSKGTKCPFWHARAGYDVDQHGRTRTTFFFLLRLRV